MKFNENIYLFKTVRNITTILSNIVIIFLTVLSITKVIFVMFETNWKYTVV